MTTCGYFWCWVIIVLCIIGVTVSAVVQDKRDRSQKPKENGLPHQRAALVRNDGAAAPVEPAARAYRRGGARYVTCSASTRLDEGYIVGIGGRSGDDPGKMIGYAKKELAAILAEQARAAGGIEFTVEGWELRPVMRTVTGREETPSTAEAVSEAGNVAPRVSILPQAPQAAGGGEL